MTSTHAVEINFDRLERMPPIAIQGARKTLFVRSTKIDR